MPRPHPFLDSHISTVHTVGTRRLQAWSEPAIRGLSNHELIRAAWEAVRIADEMWKTHSHHGRGKYDRKNVLDTVGAWLNGELSDKKILKEYRYARPLSPPESWLVAAVVRDILGRAGDLIESRSQIRQAALWSIESAQNEVLWGSSREELDPAAGQAFIQRWQRAMQNLHRGNGVPPLNPAVSGEDAYAAIEAHLHQPSQHTFEAGWRTKGCLEPRHDPSHARPAFDIERGHYYYQFNLSHTSLYALMASRLEGEQGAVLCAEVAAESILSLWNACIEEWYPAIRALAPITAHDYRLTLAEIDRVLAWPRRVLSAAKKLRDGLPYTSKADWDERGRPVIDSIEELDNDKKPVNLFRDWILAAINDYRTAGYLYPASWAASMDLAERLFMPFYQLASTLYRLEPDKGDPFWTAALTVQATATAVATSQEVVDARRAGTNIRTSSDPEEIEQVVADWADAWWHECRCRMQFRSSTPFSQTGNEE